MLYRVFRNGVVLEIDEASTLEAIENRLSGLLPCGCVAIQELGEVDELHADVISLKFRSLIKPDVTSCNERQIMYLRE